MESLKGKKYRHQRRREKDINTGHHFRERAEGYDECGDVNELESGMFVTSLKHSRLASSTILWGTQNSNLSSGLCS